ncbi:MAG: CpXC domain-containing protein [Chloroflexota bacterium]|nr:CpXC domain-containing protein [Chloroflexota bacterium]
MPQQRVARVTCPACNQPFDARVEQILDVGEDPSVKTRLLNGLINVAQCPHCGSQGALNVPFLYHDPENELALVYMPMDMGGDREQREQTIGRLTRRVMDQLPAEKRRAYLLQPEVFLTMDNLTKRILKEEGVTEEMLEEQREKAELLQRMAEAASDESLEAMIEANDEKIDELFFYMLTQNLELAQATGQDEAAQTLRHLRDKLLELSTEGQAIRARNEMLEALRDEPNRDKLLELLVETEDKATREMLVSFGRPMMDYLFFQNLTAKIKATSDQEEKQRLTDLRREILDIRDRLDEEAQALYEARSALLRDLVMSDDPRELARRRIDEIDEAFLNVLGANLQQAHKREDEDTLEALREVWGVVMGLMEEAMPPELRLINRLMAAEEEDHIERLLEESKDLVTERMVQFIEETEAKAREEGDLETAEQMALVSEKMSTILAREMLA